MLINDLPIIMVKCLILTILIEVILAFILGIRKGDTLIVILVNIMTNPLVVSLPIFMLVRFGTTYRIITLVILELLTIFVEGLVYSKTLNFKKINPYILSLILNIVSYGLGEIINHFL